MSDEWINDVNNMSTVEEYTLAMHKIYLYNQYNEEGLL